MDLTDDRRIRLALKGKRLYKKYCGLDGETTCADSFAEYHASLGEYEVVADFLDFLRHTLTTESDSAKIDMTEQLIARVEGLIS